jgi:hypothetical protein
MFGSNCDECVALTPEERMMKMKDKKDMKEEPMTTQDKIISK